MKVIFSSYHSNRNVLNKVLEQQIEFDGFLKENFEYLKPILTIMVESGTTFDYNYCYIPILKRYYYVEDIYIKNNNMVVVSLYEDVLMSFNEDIKRMVVEISESENPNDKVIDCDVENEKSLVGKIELQNPFSEKGFLYMATVKGV